MRQSMMREMGVGVFIGVAVLASGCATSTESPGDSHRSDAADVLSVELLGAVRLPGDLEVDGDPVGGLSGLTWEPTCDQWIALSDDAARYGPIRAYRLRVDLADGRLDPGDVAVEGRIVFRRPDGTLHGQLEVDPEGIEVDPRGRIWVSSEGHVSFGVEGFLRRYAGDGTFLEEKPIPSEVLAHQRHNLGMEALAFTPDGRYLFVGIENALEVDGPVSDLEVPSPTRILRWDLERGGAPTQFLYRTEPTPDAPTEAGAFRANGLTGLVALGSDRLLALERSYAVGVGNRARLFEVRLTAESEITGPVAAPDHTSAAKHRVADLEDLGCDPDNIEGMDLGPTLEGGGRLLLLVSDNNFQPDVQANLVVALRLRGGPEGPAAGPRTTTIPAIQGSGWLSPEVGRCVAGVEGVVTAVAEARDGRLNVWVQHPEGDEDPMTSDAVVLRMESGHPSPSPGDLLRVEGRVDEVARGLDLPVTTIHVHASETVDRGMKLPDPRPVPPAGGSLGSLGDAFHGGGAGMLGSWERLEGMRVVVPPATVVGPTRSFGQIALLPDDRAGGFRRTPRQGVVLTPGEPPSGHVLVIGAASDPAPFVAVGDRFETPLFGVIDHGNGAWQVERDDTVAGDIEPAGVQRDMSDSRPGRRTGATVASFNVENLSLRSG
jgi:hypothetical protein